MSVALAFYLHDIIPVGRTYLQQMSQSCYITYKILSSKMLFIAYIVLVLMNIYCTLGLFGCQRKVRQIPAPQCWTICSQEIQEGSVPNCGTCYQLSHDAWAQQWQKADGCPYSQALF